MRLQAFIKYTNKKYCINTLCINNIVFFINFDFCDILNAEIQNIIIQQKNHMDEEQVQVQTVSVSKTKMAIAIGLLGLSALAAGFTGMRARSTVKADLVFAKSTVNVEDGMNMFSITLMNKGSLAVTSPFVLNIRLGDHKNVIHTMKVQNPPSADIKGSYENLDSKDGSFDILVKNFKLKPGQATTITYWFVIPSEYEAENLPFTYTWDTTNIVSEKNELNTYKGSFNIEEMRLITEAGQIPTSTTTSTLPDLTIKNFTITDTLDPNVKNFDITIKNIGEATAVGTNLDTGFKHFSVQSFGITPEGDLTDGPRFASVDTQTTPDTNQPELGPGQELTISTPVNLTSSGFDDVNQIKMKVDWSTGVFHNIYPFTFAQAGYIQESNEDNNELTKLVDIREKLSDLIIEDFTITPSTNQGMTHFNVTIKNIGEGTAGPLSMSGMHGTFQVQLYFVGEDGTVMPINGHLASDTFHTNTKLAPGKELTISQDINISLGNHTKMKMKVDWLEGQITSLIPFIYPNGGYIQESNEDNNELTKNIVSDEASVVQVIKHTSHSTGQQVPNTASVVGAFTFVAPGQTVSLKNVTMQLTGTFIGQNIGDNSVTVKIYDGSNGTFDSHTSQLLGSGTISNVDAGTSNSSQITFTLNQEWSDTRTMFFVIDTTDSDFDYSAPQQTKVLASKLTGFKWIDQNGNEHAANAGLSVNSDYYYYN